MLTIPGQSGKSSDGLSRRDMLRLGSLSAFGMSIPGLLRAGMAEPRSKCDVSCILVWLQGGLSHIDSFDPKPDAPSAVRGEFSAISTKVPGIFLSEGLPRLATQQDKFSILRSLDPQNGTHGLAESYLLSGQPFQESMSFPSYGSVLSREHGALNGMPPYVQIGRSIDTRFGGGGSGFLGDSFRPLIVSNPSMARGKSFDLSSEDFRLRDQYGRHSLGQGCLLARKLTESGTRFVTVTDSGWDTHQDNFGQLRDTLLPRLDSAISALLQDLSDRGRLDSTLVLVLSDFGRNPKVNEASGRDHCSTASLALVAGAGIQSGVVVGRTDSWGASPAEARYVTEDLAKTLYNRLGICRDTVHPTSPGHPVELNNNGRLIRELL